MGLCGADTCMVMGCRKGVKDLLLYTSAAAAAVPYRLLWSRDVGAEVCSLLVVGGGALWVGGNDGSICVLHGASGAEERRWQVRA